MRARTALAALAGVFFFGIVARAEANDTEIKGPMISRSSGDISWPCVNGAPSERSRPLWWDGSDEQRAGEHLVVTAIVGRQTGHVDSAVSPASMRTARREGLWQLTITEKDRMPSTVDKSNVLPHFEAALNVMGLSISFIDDHKSDLGMRANPISLYLANNEFWPMRSIEFIPSQPDLFASLPRLPLGISLGMPQRFASSPPQERGGDGQHYRKYRYPSAGVVPPWEMAKAIGIGLLLGAICIAGIIFEYYRHENRHKRDNGKRERPVDLPQVPPRL